MYHPPSHSRHNSRDHDRRLSREHIVGVDASKVHQYTRPSPIATPTAYSPTNGIPPPSPHYQYSSSRPATSHGMSMASAVSPRLGPPPSPRPNGPIRGSPVYQRGTSSFYDPTAEHRETPSIRTPHNVSLKSPKQVSTRSKIQHINFESRC